MMVMVVEEREKERDKNKKKKKSLKTPPARHVDRFNSLKTTW